MDEIYVRDRAALRKWLEENYSTSTGAWMVYDKKVSGKRTLTYDDIVEEAISFGWIDSLTRSLNDQQAMYYLSPRKPKSPWSKLNKDRVEKLIKENLITKAGLDAVERSKANGSWEVYDTIEELKVPEDLRAELSNNKIARENFENFSNSNKKQILWYISSAKKPETRAKRIKKIVAEAEKNNKLWNTERTEIQKERNKK